MTALSHASVPPPHALDEDFRLLKSAVEEAGKLAHSYFRQEVAVRRKKDGTEVSDADIAVNEALKEALLGGRPDYGWLSEELEDDATRLERRLVWMVDPIDGTNAFLRHIPEWTISAALVQEGKPVLGAVFNPATGEFFHAIRGRGAFLNGKPIKVTGRETLEGALFIASGGLFKKRIWKEPWPGVEFALGQFGRLPPRACRRRQGRRHRVALRQVRVGSRGWRADRRGGRRRGHRPSRPCLPLQSAHPPLPEPRRGPARPSRQAHRAHEPRRPRGAFG